MSETTAEMLLAIGIPVVQLAGLVILGLILRVDRQQGAETTGIHMHKCASSAGPTPVDGPTKHDVGDRNLSVLCKLSHDHAA